MEPMAIEITNLTNLSVDKKFFAGVAKKVLKGENKERENFSIAFISAAEIHSLNKKYRKKDMPTDVLSFEKSSDLEEEYSEVVICPSVVKEQVQNSHLPFKKELAKMLIHGMLHALSYDHEISKEEEIKMFKKQDYYLSKVR